VPYLLRQIDTFLAFARRQMSMPRSYQGSPALYVVQKGIYHLRQSLKRARRKLLRPQTDGEVSGHLEAYEQAIGFRDWDSVLREASEIASLAERKQDAGLMTDMSKALLRLGVYDRSVELALGARQLRHPRSDKEWTGQDISDRTLLIEFIEDVKQGLGGILRFTPFLAPALAQAKRSIIVTEHRLVPLLKRTFPEADIRERSEGIEKARDDADVFARFEHLAYLFANDARTMQAGFVPLKADAELTRRFREDYAQAAAPLIGLSWGSKSYNKDVPDLLEWSRFIAASPAKFVSLQYGKVSSDLPLLTGKHPERVIHDTSVDQMQDMDRFAAQICALDAVLSISNTAAHFAGTLGVPAIVLIDDEFHTPWPVRGSRVPWYPRSHAIQKGGRDWPAVLAEAHDKLGVISRREKP
jgi:hypothetical protein